ncbi:hypothetical protein LOD99_9998 [Oopsacas minuta]|uniref:PX domain-containing protein n=1 Tax=Oopsacas minuta TaxID=111878 RepID=A0AAV7KKK5_9METZ|nr:hypothetical protein LOD99_9998 [Oopsacas minuta]
MKISLSNSLPILCIFLKTRSIEELNTLLYILVLFCLVQICYLTSPLVCLLVFIFTTLPGAVFTHFYFSGRLRHSKTKNDNISQFYSQTISKEDRHYEIQDADSVIETEIESQLDQTLSNFTNILIDNLISEWYTSIADNNELQNKSFPHINLALSNLCERAQALPLTQLSTHLLLQGLTPYFASIEHALQDTTEPFLQRLQQARTVHNFESSDYAHPALRNQAATHMYAEHMFDILLQASDLSTNLKDSFLFRSVLRDVISTSFILKLFDIVSKPHFLYQCLTFVFSLQFPSNTTQTRSTTQNVIEKQFIDDVTLETDSLPSLRARNLKAMNRKSKSYDIPDRSSRCLVRKHSHSTKDYTDIGTMIKERRGEVGRDVPQSVNPNSISIFEHELVQESLSSSYYIYSIWVPKVITNRFNQSDACIVKHRFREFEHLYRSLQNSCKELMRGISFPSKLSQIRIGTLSNHFIMRRRMLLENFLKAICVRDLVLQTADVQIFLGISTRRKQDIGKASSVSRVSRVSRAFNVNTSDFPVTQNVEDVVLKLRVFVTKQLLFSDTTESSPVLSLDPTDSSSPSYSIHTHTDDIIPLKQCVDAMTKEFSIARVLRDVTMSVLNGENVESNKRAGELMGEFPFTSSLYLFGATVLRNKQLWINTETFLILLLEMLGDSSTKILQGKMEELNTDKRITTYFEMLERKFFPDGKLHLVKPDSLSPEELNQAKSTACQTIYTFIPDLIKSVIGDDELKKAIAYCLDCLSNQAMNR